MNDYESIQIAPTQSESIRAQKKIIVKKDFVNFTNKFS